MGFPRQKYWSGLPFPSPGDHPNPGIEPESLGLAGGLITTMPPGKPQPSDYSLQTLHDNFTHYVKEALKATKTNETVLIFK